MSVRPLSDDSFDFVSSACHAGPHDTDSRGSWVRQERVFASIVWATEALQHPQGRRLLHCPEYHLNCVSF